MIDISHLFIEIGRNLGENLVKLITVWTVITQEWYSILKTTASTILLQHDFVASLIYFAKTLTLFFLKSYCQLLGAIVEIFLQAAMKTIAIIDPKAISFNNDSAMNSIYGILLAIRGWRNYLGVLVAFLYLPTSVRIFVKTFIFSLVIVAMLSFVKIN